MQPCINMPYFRNILFSPLINRQVPSSLALGCSKPTAAGRTWSRSTHFKEEELADPAACSLLLCFSVAFCMAFGLTITCQQFLCNSRETRLAFGQLCEGHWRAASHKRFLRENAPDNAKTAENTWYHLLPLLGNRIWDPVPLRWQQPWHSQAAQLFCSTTSCWWARGRDWGCQCKPQIKGW